MKECPNCNTCYDDTSRFCTYDGNPLSESLPGSRTLEGRYQLTKLIGQGRLGDVYQATDLQTAQQVSVKVLPPHLFTTQEAELKFRAEVNKLKTLSAPNIAATYSFGNLPNACTYLVSEFVQGRSLRDETKEQKILPTLRALEIARQAAIGLGFAHQIGVLHLDLKPDNLLLMADSQTQAITVKVVDFGVARLKDSLGGAVATDTGSLIIRMPHYTSPEECTGQATDHRSDIYSLGIILYEMLTGKVPFHDRLPMRVIVMHANQPAPSMLAANPNLSPHVEALVLKMLAKSPNDRPSSMDVVASEIRKLIQTGELPVRLQPTAKPSAAPESAKPDAPPAAPALNLPLRLTIIDTDDEGHKSRTIQGMVLDATAQGMKIQTGTVATGQLNIVKDQTVAFKNRLQIEVDLPTGTVRMDGFAVRYNRAPDGMNWTVFIYIKDMPRADRKNYEEFLKTVG